MKYLFFLIISLLLFTQCNFKTKETEQKGFYESIAGWDIIHVPIIPPFKATSTDNGRIWSIGGSSQTVHLAGSRYGDIPVLSFGVSDNYIYGTSSEDYSQHIDKWFLFNTKTLLYSDYATEEELKNTLSKFHLKLNPIEPCQHYFKQLSSNQRCYWYPPKGSKYSTYKDIQPDSAIDVTITEDSKALDFKIKSDIEKQESKIYYFKMKYDKENNELFYISIENSTPVLIKNNQVIPAFINGSYFSISVYTPLPIARAKEISEKDRIVETRQFYLK